MAITSAQFEQVRTLVVNASGIQLPPGSEARVDADVARLAAALKLSTVEFFRNLEQGRVNDAGFLLSEAVADLETSFFRDALPFDALRRSILPELIQHRAANRELTIWSAGCSTGQEPYSVAIQLREYFPQLAEWNIQIHAAEIAETALKAAQAGVYSQADVNRGVPAPLLLKHFQKTNEQWHLKDSVRYMVRYTQINLAETWPELPPMDLILLRNLVSGWNKATQDSVLERAERLLRPGGYLVLGNKETLPILEDLFEAKAHGKITAYTPKKREEAQVTRLNVDTGSRSG